MKIVSGTTQISGVYGAFIGASFVFVCFYIAVEMDFDYKG
jgi:hypothetical protein